MGFKEKIQYSVLEGMEGRQYVLAVPQVLNTEDIILIIFIIASNNMLSL